MDTSSSSASRDPSSVLLSTEGSSVIRVIRGDGTAEFVSASEIFRLAKAARSREDSGVHLDDTTANLRFEGLPARVMITIGESDQLQVLAEHRGKRHLLDSLDADHAVVDGRWVRLDPVTLDVAREFLEHHGASSPLEQSAAGALDDSGVLQLPPPSEFISTDPVASPEGLEAELRDYQSAGLGWLSRLAAAGIGGILGDQMGLGKTIIAIALMCHRKEGDPSARSMVVVPLSLVDNWCREIHRFAPDLRVYVHHGSDRVLLADAIRSSDLDVMITTYDIVVRDRVVLSQLRWDLVFCDEAQNVKNHTTRRWQAVSSMERRSCILVTGTPLENRIEDICSLASLAAPRIVPSPTSLATRFQLDPAALSRWVKPLMMRRRLADVGIDLPPRIDQTLWLSMNPRERDAYNAVIRSLSERDATALEVVSQLRMASSHPGLVLHERPLDPRKLFRDSSKCDELLSRLLEAQANGEKALVFVGWRRLMDALLEGLGLEAGVRCLSIDGRTPPGERQAIVDRFSTDPDTPVLLLSPRAAGVGMNIQAASRVHHLTLDWNPAVEAQATARAHRSGQTMPVHATRYVYGGTIDELIEEKIAEKLELSELVVESNAGDVPTAAEVARLLSMQPTN